MTGQRMAYTEEMAALAAAALEGAHPRVVLQWAVETFGDRFCVTSSMGDAVLAHLAAGVRAGIDVVFLDTGYHFPQTLETRDRIAAELPVHVVNVEPERTVGEQNRDHGPQLYARDPDLCCALRKVRPLDQALAGYDAWASGIRRDESPTRADIRVVDYDAKRNMVKISPIAAWTQQQVDSYIEENSVLINPLFFDGYTSIGCEPCTRRALPGEDPRAGRWAGSAKTECGLHT